MKIVGVFFLTLAAIVLSGGIASADVAVPPCTRVLICAPVIVNGPLLGGTTLTPGSASNGGGIFGL